VKAHDTSGDEMNTAGQLLADGFGDHWVDAAPFRALLRYLMALGRVSAADLAALTGLPDGLVEHLAHGRDGRRVRRISAYAAFALIQLTAEQVRELRAVMVPSGLARAKVERLRQAGWTEAEVMDAIGATPPERRAITTSGSSCSQLLLVRLRGLCRQLDADLELDGLDSGGSEPRILDAA
jgi:hypothetical protein